MQVKEGKYMCNKVWDLVVRENESVSGCQVQGFVCTVDHIGKRVQNLRNRGVGKRGR